MSVEDHHIDLARKVECEADGLYFCRYFFKQRFDFKMMVSAHHFAMQAALDRTMLPPNHPDFISRLIIGVPPGYTKTEMAAISYMARGLAVNPQARFLHLSNSDDLALLNSTTVRSIVKSQEYQTMWGVKTKNDVDSKSLWHTVQGGGVKAGAAGGQVIGFRAGQMDDTKFTGALIIDDPIKPDDAYKEVVREYINNRYNETIASRVAIETNPIILIMQPVHWHDLTAYLLMGGSGEKWHHLQMPVKIDNNAPYPEEYTHGIQIDHGLPDGWLWPFKHNEQHEVALKAHRRRYWAQYMMKPIKRDEESALWTEKTIALAREKDFKNPVRTLVSVDPAVSNNPNSDENGIGVASCCDDEQMTRVDEKGKRVKVPVFTVDADYSLKGSPRSWAERAIAAYNEHEADAIVIEINQGGDMCVDTLRNAGFTGRIIEVRARKGKTLRAEPIAALYELGYVQHKPGLSILEEEMLDFDPLTGLSAGKSPNRVDWLVWVLKELSGADTSFEDVLSMAIGANK